MFGYYKKCQVFQILSIRRNFNYSDESQIFGIPHERKAEQGIFLQWSLKIQKSVLTVIYIKCMEKAIVFSKFVNDPALNSLDENKKVSSESTNRIIQQYYLYTKYGSAANMKHCIKNKYKLSDMHTGIDGFIAKCLICK